MVPMPHLPAEFCPLLGTQPHRAEKGSWSAHPVVRSHRAPNSGPGAGGRRARQQGAGGLQLSMGLRAREAGDTVVQGVRQPDVVPQAAQEGQLLPEKGFHAPGGPCSSGPCRGGRGWKGWRDSQRGGLARWVPAGHRTGPCLAAGCCSDRAQGQAGPPAPGTHDERPLCSSASGASRGQDLVLSALAAWGSGRGVPEPA